MKKFRTKHIVTKASLQSMIENADEKKRAQIVGRALVVLFNRQTEDEKTADDTRHTNFKGFTSGDARSGSITAKSFLKNGTLADWQVERWTRKNVKGTMRIAKYWRQLDEAAHAKAAKSKETTVEAVMGQTAYDVVQNQIKAADVDLESALEKQSLKAYKLQKQIEEKIGIKVILEKDFAEVKGVFA